MVIFYRMLDISTVNAHVLYQADGANTIERGNFIKILARNTVLLHMKRRVYNTHVPRDVRINLARILGSDLPPEPQNLENTPKIRKTCASCPPKLNRKSNYQCNSCKKHVYMNFNCALSVSKITKV